MMIRSVYAAFTGAIATVLLNLFATIFLLTGTAAGGCPKNGPEQWSEKGTEEADDAQQRWEHLNPDSQAGPRPCIL